MLNQCIEGFVEKLIPGATNGSIKIDQTVCIRLKDGVSIGLFDGNRPLLSEEHLNKWIRADVGLIPWPSIEVSDKKEKWIISYPKPQTLQHGEILGEVIESKSKKTTEKSPAPGYIIHIDVGAGVINVLSSQRFSAGTFVNIKGSFYLKKVFSDSSEP